VPEVAWYRKSAAELERVVGDAMAVQPRMWLDDERERVAFRGRFDICEGGAVIEAFAVDVVLAKDSPRGLPSVWEVGGRIPRVADPHHVNIADGSLCVVLPEAFWLEHPEGLTLAEYLEGPLRRHLAGQAMVLRGEEWPAGEWRHGADGKVQFYRELFGADDNSPLTGFFDLLGREKVKGHWICPCGSGEKLRDCHGEQVHRVRERLPAALLEPFRSRHRNVRRRTA
jgi:hypothetical protein